MVLSPWRTRPLELWTMTTFPIPPQKATVNEIFLEKSSCVIAAAALCSPKGKVRPVLGRDGTNSLQALHFLCLSALCCSWRGGPAEEGPKGCAAAKYWRENWCTIQSKYHFTITSSKEELWRIKQLIASVSGCFSTHTEIWPRGWSSHLSLLHTNKPVFPRDLSQPALARIYHA